MKQKPNIENFKSNVIAWLIVIGSISVVGFIGMGISISNDFRADLRIQSLTQSFTWECTEAINISSYEYPMGLSCWGIIFCKENETKDGVVCKCSSDGYNTEYNFKGTPINRTYCIQEQLVGMKREVMRELTPQEAGFRWLDNADGTGFNATCHPGWENIKGDNCPER